MLSESSMSKLRSSVNWKKRIAGQYVAWLNDKNFTYKYDKHPAHIPQPLAENELVMKLRDIMMEISKLQSPPGSVHLNKYTGTAGLKVHSDDEPIFGPGVADKTIISHTCGGTREMIILAKDTNKDVGRLSLGSSTTLIMGALCQDHYMHGIIGGASAATERISLTWRYLCEVSIPHLMRRKIA